MLASERQAPKRGKHQNGKHQIANTKFQIIFNDQRANDQNVLNFDIGIWNLLGI
jgi:hypothetical protein